ncbi:MAG: competence protein ComL [Pelagibacteraceae bacterium BACL20 MAG-120920-bin64]|jgi:outer membrane protein assembly factor BamD|nr:MAG: competence protein ComL [Pelagibacteraceae bacterium BACL20 MAG-120920-bin64]|tara:strand:+ start:954 stop:1802 length:849 start_codon:yes stop_codon:yes gene_type:complete
MISKFKILFILVALLFVYSCGDKTNKISEIVEVDMEMQMSNAYKEGYFELQRGDVLLAAKKFNEAELLFPQSPWAAKSAIMAAYAYYTQDYYSDTIFELERYLKTYPNHKDKVYAHFLLGMSFYEQIVDEKKDLKSILDAKNQFELIIKEYPASEFAMDAKFKIDLINEILAAKEMYIARYYLNKSKWIPALNRFKTVVNKYNTTIYTEEALHRLVEINYRLGLIDESKKYANTLGYNYQSSDWYKNSYKVFNTNYRDGIEEIQKDKKKKIGLIKRFKGLFE